MRLDVRGQIQRMLAHQAFGEFGVALFQRLDDAQMIGDRA